MKVWQFNKFARIWEIAKEYGKFCHLKNFFMDYDLRYKGKKNKDTEIKSNFLSDLKYKAHYYTYW